MMDVASLLAEGPNPDAEKIIGSLDDVICPCGTHPRIKNGVKKAIEIMGKGGR